LVIPEQISPLRLLKDRCQEEIFQRGTLDETYLSGAGEKVRKPKLGGWLGRDGQGCCEGSQRASTLFSASLLPVLQVISNTYKRPVYLPKHRIMFSKQRLDRGLGYGYNDISRSVQSQTLADWTHALMRGIGRNITFDIHPL
jgi:hypothetical protein